jgi:hypothetical protein
MGWRIKRRSIHIFLVRAIGVLTVTRFDVFVLAVRARKSSVNNLAHLSHLRKEKQH